MTQHNDEPADDDYKVGYRKPPKHSQFQPGQSGNPKGRPKGSRNFKSDVLDTLKTPIPVTQDGKKRKVSTQKAALMRLREKALSGDHRALDRLLELARLYNDEEMARTDTSRSPDDEAILEAYATRIRSSLSNDLEQTDPTGDDPDAP